MESLYHSAPGRARTWFAKSALTVSTGAIVLFLMCTACSNVVDPMAEGAEKPRYYVYGFLDSSADTQYVRLQALRSQPERQELPQDRPVVRTRSLESEQPAIWQDSLVTLDDGTTGLLYYAVFTPAPGSHHELEILQSGEVITRATTTVPEVPGLHVEPVQSDSEPVQQFVTLSGFRRIPEDASTFYWIVIREDAPRKITFPYTQGGTVSTEGWNVIVHLARDLAAVRSQLGLSPQDTTAQFCGIGIVTSELSSEWQTLPSRGNVQNGAGFFGSVGRYVHTWSLDEETIRSLGFAICQTEEKFTLLNR